MSEQTVAVDFTQLLEPADTQVPEAQATPLERAIAEAGAESASTELAVARPEDSPFKFRGLLTEKQLADLQHGAPMLAKKFIDDVNQIVSFGGPVMQKMNSASVQLLEAQRDIKVPEADAVVNDMLRTMDGFEKKWRSQ